VLKKTFKQSTDEIRIAISSADPYLTCALFESAVKSLSGR